MTAKIMVITAYALMIIVIGILGLRKTKSFSDFFLGGRNVGPIMTAFTYGTAYFSAVLFIGFAGKIGWGFGYSGLWIALGNALVGVLGVWWFLGWRIKKMSVEYKVSTMGEYLEKRYRSRFLRFFGAVCIFVFLIPYSAAVFIGLSYLFRSNFNLEFTIALGFMGIFTAIYLVLGGYKSMTMIDVIFGLIMIVGVVVLMVFTVDKGSGLAAMTADLKSIEPKLTAAVGPPGLWPLISLVVLTSLAPFAMPQLIQKFYAVRDKKAIRIGMVASTLFAVLIGGSAYFIGSTTRLFLSPESAPRAFHEGRPVFDVLMPELLSKTIPHSLSVIILLLILSASMSTLAALVLISSSAVVKDLVAGFIKRDVADAAQMRLMRWMSGFFILTSVVFAYFRPASIVAILGISWGAIGAVFLGPFIWGLFTEWVTAAGAIGASMLGLAACLGLYAAKVPSPEAGTVGMMISLLFPPLLTWLFSVRGKTHPAEEHGLR